MRGWSLCSVVDNMRRLDIVRWSQFVIPRRLLGLMESASCVAMVRFRDSGAVAPWISLYSRICAPCFLLFSTHASCTISELAVNDISYLAYGTENGNLKKLCATCATDLGWSTMTATRLFLAVVVSTSGG